jgi:hypothetical protein
MMTPGSILIVGRGKSAYTFDWSTVECPILAISSGIFAVPRYRCNHFVTLDEPKYYMAQLMADAPHAWEHDPGAEHWPFWTDPNLVKHVPTSKLRTLTNLIMPVNEIIEAIDLWASQSQAKTRTVNRIKAAFYGTLGEQYSQFGLQPGWGDYQNVRGWGIRRNNKPAWDGDGPLHIPRVFNSLFMALQVASRLGHKHMRFIGVDLDREFYDSALVFLKRWHKDAGKHGIEWVNHSGHSALAEFVDTDADMDIVDAMQLLASMGAVT